MGNYTEKVKNRCISANSTKNSDNTLCKTRNYANRCHFVHRFVPHKTKSDCESLEAFCGKISIVTCELGRIKAKAARCNGTTCFGFLAWVQNVLKSSPVWRGWLIKASPPRSESKCVVSPATRRSVLNTLAALYSVSFESSNLISFACSLYVLCERLLGVCFFKIFYSQFHSTNNWINDKIYYV